MKPPSPTTDEQLVARLREHPRLRERMERMLELVEDPQDAVRLADEAERRVIEEVRGLGRELVEDWAEGQIEKRARALAGQPGVWREGKKKSAGTPCSETLRSPSHSTGKGRGGGDR